MPNEINYNCIWSIENRTVATPRLLNNLEDLY